MAEEGNPYLTQQIYAPDGPNLDAFKPPAPPISQAARQNSRVPMVMPDGTLKSVANDAAKIKEYVGLGAEVGVPMRFSDGDKDITKLVRASKVAELQKHGSVDWSLLPSKEYEGGLAALAGDVWGAIKHLPQALTMPFTPEGHVAMWQNAVHAEKADQARKAEGWSPEYRVAARVAGAVGTNVEGMEEAARQGDTGAVLGHAAAPVAVAGIAAGVGEALPSVARAAESVRGGAKAIANWRKPPNSAVAPIAQEARDVATTLRPARGGEFSDVETAIQNQGGAVKGYAARNKNQLNTVWDWQKAAEGARDEAAGVWNREVMGRPLPERDWFGKTLAPDQAVVEHHVDVSGTGFKGNPEATTASLGDVEARLADINRQLRTPAREATPEQAASALSTEQRAALQAEASALRPLFYGNLEELTGFSRESLQQLHQRVGQTNTLASSAKLRAQEIAQASTNAQTGANLPISKGQVVAKVGEAVTGGAEGGVNRAFQKSIKNFSGSDLPADQVLQPVGTPGYGPASNGRQTSPPMPQPPAGLLPAPQAQIPPGPQFSAEASGSVPYTPPAVGVSTRPARLGNLLPPAQTELPGQVAEAPAVPYSNTTAPDRLGRLLPEGRVGAGNELPAHSGPIEQPASGLPPQNLLPAHEATPLSKLAAGGKTAVKDGSSESANSVKSVSPTEKPLSNLAPSKRAPKDTGQVLELRPSTTDDRFEFASYRKPDGSVGQIRVPAGKYDVGDIVGELASRARGTEVTPAGGSSKPQISFDTLTGGTPVLKTNRSGMSVLDNVIGGLAPESGTSRGIFLRGYSRAKRLFEQYAEKNSGEPNAQALSRLLPDVAGKEPTGVIAIDMENPLRSVIEVTRHELAHEFDAAHPLAAEDYSSLAAGLRKDFKPFVKMIQSKGMGYGKMSDMELVHEAVAHLSGETFKSYGGTVRFAASPEQISADFLAKYFEAVKKKHGVEALNDLAYTGKTARAIKRSVAGEQ